MTHELDYEPRLLRNPADTLAKQNAARFEEVTFIESELRSALELLEDLETVNMLLRSVDPRLAIAKRVEMFKIESPKDIRMLNNYPAYLSAFGEPLYSPHDHSGSNTSKQFIGRRPPIDDEKQKYFTLGLERPDKIDDYYSLAQQLGFSEDRCGDLYTANFFKREANLRAYVLFPELFNRILHHCLETDRTNLSKYMNEEVYAAYAVSARLVSMEDRQILKEDGEIDDWLLCR